MATYDADKRPPRPFPYFNEVMTGFEYTAATGLLQAGADRARGWRSSAPSATATTARKRNPFDEAECGHHYARAMASWSAFATWNDVWYDGRSRELTVGSRLGRGQRFWSNGSAFGSWCPGAEPGSIGTLLVVRGELALDALVVDGVRASPSPTAVLTRDTPWTVPAAART